MFNEPLTQDEAARIAAFLADLTALTLRHGIVIAGCGCCGSPYLEEGMADGANGYTVTGDQNLKWDSPGESP